MVNMTLAIPKELHKLIKKHREIKWSEVARQAMWKQAKQAEIISKLISKNKINEKELKQAIIKLSEKDQNVLEYFIEQIKGDRK